MDLICCSHIQRFLDLLGVVSTRLHFSYLYFPFVHLLATCKYSNTNLQLHLVSLPLSQILLSSPKMARPVYHQDYIARIRYSNALPPPPFLPKFLDIPNTGLSTGQYTSAGFASRLAREQPLNIEADAELGMPIDLIGIKGVFDGDESGMSSQCTKNTLH